MARSAAKQTTPKPPAAKPQALVRVINRKLIRETCGDGNWRTLAEMAVRVAKRIDPDVLAREAKKRPRLMLLPLEQRMGRSALRLVGKISNDMVMVDMLKKEIRNGVSFYRVVQDRDRPVKPQRGPSPVQICRMTGQAASVLLGFSSVDLIVALRRAATAAGGPVSVAEVVAALGDRIDAAACRAAAVWRLRRKGQNGNPLVAKWDDDRCIAWAVNEALSALAHRRLESTKYVGRKTIIKFFPVGDSSDDGSNDGKEEKK